MTAGERMTREEVIGKPTADRKASGFVAFLNRWQSHSILRDESGWFANGQEAWKIATETDFGREHWGERLDGWTFEELEEDLDDVAFGMQRDGRDGSESIMGALWRRDLDRGRGKPWVIPGLLRRGDRMMVTGETGTGKSLLLQQIGVQIACGIHPFTGETIEPRSVLIVDPENPDDEILTRLGILKDLAGDAANRIGEFLHLYWPDELDLSSHEGREMLEELCWTPWGEPTDLLLLGPLYRIVRGDLNDKKTADPILDVLDQIRKSGTAINLEAHTAKDGGAGPPSGSAAWMQWPEVGIGITKTGAIRTWRTPRRSGLTLPTRLERDERWDRSRWPFRPVTTESTSSTGTAGDLSSVVLDFLGRHDEEEFSRSRLGDQLRGEGATFSNRALPAAIESLIEKGSITEKKIGKASILRILRNPPSLSAEDTKEPRKSIEPSSSGGASLEAPEEDGSEDRDDDLGGPDEEHEVEQDGGWPDDDELY